MRNKPGQRLHQFGTQKSNFMEDKIKYWRHDDHRNNFIGKEIVKTDVTSTRVFVLTEDKVSDDKLVLEFPTHLVAQKSGWWQK